MARREITQYFDDIDNTPLTEDQVHVVRFGVNGINYVLDLSADNAQKFEDALAPFIEKRTELRSTSRHITIPRRFVRGPKNMTIKWLIVERSRRM